MMNDRDMLLRKMAQTGFAMWELHMYLDTHPNDQMAMQKMKEYETKNIVYTKEYESKYGPIVAGDAGQSRWSWLCDPWPWDNPEEEY